MVTNVQLPKWSDLKFDGKDGLDAIWDHDFCGNMEAFLNGYVDPPVRSIADIVRYNTANHELELPAGTVSTLQ